MARLASILAALGLAAGNVGLNNDGQIPAHTRDWVTSALVAVAGLLAPSIIRIPNPARAQLYGIVGALVAGGLNLIAQKATTGNATANTVVLALTLAASLLAPGAHLHNAPGVDAAAARVGEDRLPRRDVP